MSCKIGAVAGKGSTGWGGANGGRAGGRLEVKGGSEGGWCDGGEGQIGDAMQQKGKMSGGWGEKPEWRMGSRRRRGSGGQGARLGKTGKEWVDRGKDLGDTDC